MAGSILETNSVDQEQHRQLDCLKAKVHDVIHLDCAKDTDLIRWLRSRYWNVEETEKVFREHLAWREKNGVDSFLPDYQMPPVIERYFPGGICGSDRQGRPLYVAPVGRLDPKSFMKAVSREEFIRSRIFVLGDILKTVLPEASMKEQKEINQLVVIVDMEGLGFKHMAPSWLSFLAELVKMAEANYPEILGASYVINAPPLFYRLYNFIKRYVTAETQEKIQILDANYRDKLLELFDPECLPAVYGGTITDADGDPRCPSRICWAGPVPDSFIAATSQQNTSEIRRSLSRSGSAQSLGAGDPFSTIDIGRGERRDIPIGFLPSGADLNWRVMCESYDVGVGWFAQFNDSPTRTHPLKQPVQASRSLARNVSLKFRRDQSLTEFGEVSSNGTVESDDNLFEVLPIERISTSQRAHPGTHRVQNAGYYFMRLDNSYSWTRVKRVRYSFKVIPPGEQPSIVDETAATQLSSTATHDRIVRSYSDCNSHFVSNGELHVFPIPLENQAYSRLVTGGSMDVNISLLFRLFAQLLLVPKFASLRHSASH